MTATGDRETLRRHVALLGGLRKEGQWQAGRSITHVALIGGTVMDLTAAKLEDKVLTIISIAAVGGAKLTVPAAVDLQLQVYSILDTTRVDAGASRRNHCNPSALSARSRSHRSFAGEQLVGFGASGPLPERCQSSVDEVVADGAVFDSAPVVDRSHDQRGG